MSPAGSPKFAIIIGAPKAGTTSLAEALARHPDVSLCRSKEPRFFTDFAARAWRGPGTEGFVKTMIGGEGDYLAAFDPGAEWCVDASTDYLWCDAAPDRIADWSRRFEVRIVCLLRDPLARAVSEYQHTLRDRMQTEPLHRSLALEDDRHARGMHPLFYHRRRSTYLRQVERYKALFGERMLVLDFHDPAGPQRLYEATAGFLGLTADGAVRIGHENASFAYRGRLGRLVTDKRVADVARLLVPKRFRQGIRARVEAQARTRYVPGAADRAALLESLGEELRACAASDLIPTRHWPSLAGPPAG